MCFDMGNYMGYIWIVFVFVIATYKCSYQITLINYQCTLIWVIIWDVFVVFVLFILLPMCFAYLRLCCFVVPLLHLRFCLYWAGGWIYLCFSEVRVCAFWLCLRFCLSLSCSVSLYLFYCYAYVCGCECMLMFGLVFLYAWVCAYVCVCGLCY